VTDVRFPQLSREEPDAEGVLATWFVRDGDHVAEGQLIAEVMVNKVSIEVLAPEGGEIHLLVTEEQAVRQGDAIARLS